MTTSMPDMSAVGADIKTKLAAKAPSESPALTGTPTAPTAGTGTKTTQLATTAFVYAALTARYKEIITTNGGTVPA